MYGYASALHLLAVAWARTGRRPPAGLRAVFTTAEPLFDWQKKAIESAFGCPAAVEYGCRDGGLAALECPEGGLHIAAEHMVVEIADPDAEGRGEIVLTNLDSRALPIIRYRTGDIGSLDGTPCPCGRGLPRLGAVEGRRTDFLVTPRGRVLHALSVIYPLREMTAIREFRVVQESIDRVVVRVVPERPLGAVGRADLARPLEALLGPDVRVEVEEVAAIPRTASGKFRYVESRITGDHQIPLTHPGRVPTARVSRSHDR
jgi:phenylacetate-CoA ligase